jgi:hypothetical protein
MINKTAFSSFATLASLLISANPALANRGFQWRSTTCQVEGNNQVLSSSRCSAGFASDGVIRAVKYYWPDGEAEYLEVGQNANFTGSSDCVEVNYTDGDTWSFCTTPSASQLGIMGD